MPDDEFNPFGWLQNLFPPLPQPQEQPTEIPQWMINELNNLKWYSNGNVKSNLQTLEQNTDNIISLVNQRPYLVTSQDLSNILSSYALRTDIPDVSQFVTFSDLPDFSQFALKTDIPDLTLFVTKEELDTELSSYALKTDIPTVRELRRDLGIPEINQVINSIDSIVSSMSSNLGPYPVKINNNSYALSDVFRQINSDISSLSGVVSGIDTMTPEELKAYLGLSSISGIEPFVYGDKSIKDWLDQVDMNQTDIGNTYSLYKNLDDYVSGITVSGSDFREDLKTFLSSEGVALKSDIPTDRHLIDTIKNTKFGFYSVSIDNVIDNFWPYRDDVKSMSTYLPTLSSLLSTNPQSVPDSLLVKYVSPFDGKVFDNADDYYSYLNSKKITTDSTILVFNDIMASFSYTFLVKDDNGTYRRVEDTPLDNDPWIDPNSSHRFWDASLAEWENYSDTRVDGSYSIDATVIAYYYTSMRVSDYINHLKNAGFSDDDVNLILSNLNPYPKLPDVGRWLFNREIGKTVYPWINEAYASPDPPDEYHDYVDDNNPTSTDDWMNWVNNHTYYDSQGNEVTPINPLDYSNDTEAFKNLFISNLGLKTSDEVNQILSDAYAPKLMAIDGTVFSPNTSVDDVKQYSLNLLNSMVAYSGNSFAPKLNVLEFMSSPEGIATIFSLKDYEEDNRKSIDSIEMTLQNLEQAVDYAIDPSELQQALNDRLKFYASLDYVNNVKSSIFTDVGFDVSKKEFYNTDVFSPMFDTVYSGVASKINDPNDVSGIYKAISTRMANVSLGPLLSSFSVNTLNDKLPDTDMGTFLTGVYEQIGWNEGAIDGIDNHFDTIEAEMEDMKTGLYSNIHLLYVSSKTLSNANANLPSTDVSIPNVNLNINDLNGSITSVSSKLSEASTKMSNISNGITSISGKIQSTEDSIKDVLSHYNSLEGHLIALFNTPVTTTTTGIYGPQTETWDFFDALNWLLSIDDIGKLTWRETGCAFKTLMQLTNDYGKPLLDEIDYFAKHSKDSFDNIKETLDSIHSTFSSVHSTFSSLQSAIEELNNFANDVKDRLSMIESNINIGNNQFNGLHSDIVTFRKNLDNLPSISPAPLPPQDFLKDVDLSKIKLQLPKKPDIGFSF